MSRKLVLYIAASLDGYIAAENDDLDWLLNVEGEGDNGFGAFYDTVDTILMGRRTYDWIMSHEDSFPYADKECFVFSEKNHGNTEYVTFVNDNAMELVSELKSGDGKNIWLVGGSKLIDCFVSGKAIDEMIINIAPVITGKGIPLFLSGEVQSHLVLTDIRRYNQFAELHYDVIND